MAQDGRSTEVDSVPFDLDHTCVLCMWEWEVPLAHLLSQCVHSWSQCVHNNSCSHDLILNANDVLGIMLRC